MSGVKVIQGFLKMEQEAAVAQFRCAQMVRLVWRYM